MFLTLKVLDWRSNLMVCVEQLQRYLICDADKSVASLRSLRNLKGMMAKRGIVLGNSTMYR